MSPSALEREIHALRRQGIKYDLDRMLAIVERLGHPERRYRTLHVAGTNGKGSTAAFLASILQAAGYRTGLNTSPHLVSFRERVRVDGRALEDTELLGVFRELRPILDAVEASFFEAATALAFVAFERAAVDVAVFEVGLGGRLDATNVIDPAGTIITQLDLEHTRILGDSIEAIAREKGGIIKNCPVVTTATGESVVRALSEIARERGAPFRALRAGVDFEARRDALVIEGGETFPIGLTGLHQAENAAAAHELARILDRTGALRIPLHAIAAGLAGVRWPGRFDVREHRGVPVVLDVAHNVSGARALVDTAMRTFPGARVSLVVGMLKDKAHEAFLEALEPLSLTPFLVTPSHEERKLEAKDLARCARAIGLCPEISPSLAAAIDAASRAGEVVVVTGSLFTVGAAMVALGVDPAAEPAGLPLSGERAE